MKKFLIICALLGFTSVQAAPPTPTITLGVSGTASLLDVKGQETLDSGLTAQSNRTEEVGAGYISVFGEMHLMEIMGAGLRLGASYVPYALESETTERTVSEGETGSDVIGQQLGASRAGYTQKVSVDIEDLMAAYVSVHYELLGNNVFIKGGVMEADLVTKETLATGSSYPNATLEGIFGGVGLDRDLDNGMFLRAELSLMEFDDIKLRSTGSDLNNIIDVTDMTGTNATISIGKTF